MNNTKNEIWNKIFKNSAVYLFGTVIAKMVSFFMLPLYTNKIPTEVYGIYDMVVAYASIIVPLIGVNCWQGMLRFILEESDLNERHRIVSNGWFMLICSIILLSIGFFSFCAAFPISNKILIYFYFLTQLLQYFYLYTARGFEKNTIYAISGIISAFLVAISSLFCIYFLDYDIEALYISMIVSLIGQCVYMESQIHLLRDINVNNIKKDMLKKLYKYCFPESIGTIFNWLLSSINRLIIVAVLGYTANGIYAISNKFLAILNIFMTAFVLSFQESIYSAKSKDVEKVGNEVLGKFVRFAGVAVAIILLGTSIIYPVFVSGDYTEGYTLIPFFYLHFLISGVTWILSSIVSATKKTQIILYEKMIIGIINFSIMALMIHKIGLYSSPIALFFAEVVGILIYKFLLNKIARQNISIPVKNIVLDILILLFASVFFYINNLWMSVMVLTIVLLILIIIFRKMIRQIVILFINIKNNG